MSYLLAQVLRHGSACPDRLSGYGLLRDAGHGCREVAINRCEALRAFGAPFCSGYVHFLQNGLMLTQVYMTDLIPLN